jgi:hypothetical protein
MGEKSDKIEWKFGCKLISWRKLSREKIICNFIAIEKDLGLIDNHKADFYGKVFLLFVIVLFLLAGRGKSQNRQSHFAKYHEDNCGI